MDALGRFSDASGVSKTSDLILGRFGEGLSGIWRGFGECFAKVLEDFGKIYFDFLHWDPRAVSLRPAERHNFTIVIYGPAYKQPAVDLHLELHLELELEPIRPLVVEWH